MQSTPLGDQQQLVTVLRTMRALDDLAGHLRDVPDFMFTNALLNSAVERLLHEQGFARTSSTLQRLAGLVGAGMTPPVGQALDLNGTNS